MASPREQLSIIQKRKLNKALMYLAYSYNKVKNYPIMSRS